ncbi:hypothetical protein ABZ330_17525 [Streptomyces sp. NPDC006172]|uniref:hypothetical protein n=1 Tax=Streptomyces sp. NPDC006172 TaxID=3154470 RepID=UPI0033F73C22
MTVGGCSRALRAAVFAAVCVLLASLGHTMMSGATVPWWAAAAAVAAAGGTAWRLADRERGPVLVASLTVAAQAALHVSFSLAQALAPPGPPDGPSLARRWLGYVLCGSPSGPGTGHDLATTSMGSTGSMTSSGAMDHAMSAMPSMPSMHVMGSMHSVHAMGSMHEMGAVHSLDHGSGAMSSTGMLAAHLLAALVCGLWLAHGERAGFRVLRALAGWFAAPLRLMLRLPAPPHRPRIRARRARSDRAPRELLLTFAITSRGPPVGTAVA